MTCAVAVKSASERPSKRPAMTDQPAALSAAACHPLRNMPIPVKLTSNATLWIDEALELKSAGAAELWAKAEAQTQELARFCWRAVGWRPKCDCIRRVVRYVDQDSF